MTTEEIKTFWKQPEMVEYIARHRSSVDSCDGKTIINRAFNHLLFDSEDGRLLVAEAIMFGTIDAAFAA